MRPRASRAGGAPSRTLTMPAMPHMEAYRSKPRGHAPDGRDPGPTFACRSRPRPAAFDFVSVIGYAEQPMGTVNQEQVRRDVTAFIVENFLFGNVADAPKPETSFMETGLVDSTGILELVAHLESAYGVSVADDELIPENLDSVASIAAFVVRKKGG